MSAAADWTWCGYAGHFIGGRNCRFHLNTRVGDYRVSTVGEWATDENPEPQPISTNFLTTPPTNFYFETMVFPLVGDGEGEVTEWGGIETARYVTAEEAETGHVAMCWRYAARAKTEQRG